MLKPLLYAAVVMLIPNLVMGSSYFFEPSIGYRTERVKFTDKVNNQSQLKMQTPTYGLKLGYRSLLGVDLNLAGDYSSGNAEWSPLTEKVSFKHTMAAVQLGISALGAMKIYLGYAFLNTLQIDKGLLNSDLNLSGPAYQAGLQFRLFSSVTLGAQYNLNQFNKVTGTNFTLVEKTESYFNKLDVEDYFLSLSISF